MLCEILLILGLAFSYVHSHGILINPIARGSIWRLESDHQPVEHFAVRNL